MIFAEFWHNSTGYVAGTIPPQYSPDSVKLIPACGSDSVAVLDGRLGPARRIEEARAICKKRGFLGFSIHAGESFSRSSTIRNLEKVKK